MAQQITIDIVAETKKLTSGIDDANKQLGGMSKQLKTAASAAAGLASAFVLKQGVSFLKDGIVEAKDARSAMLAATSAFGAGSDAIKKITTDAEKFGKEIAVDNDDIIRLATGIGVKLPAGAKGASAELVLLAKNLEATSGGSIAAEATLSKLGKSFADGVVTAKELQKTIPGLDAATYAMAETLSKAGKNQDALNLLITEGEKKYGGAAASQVTATQKFDVALANLKETIGTKILPMLEKLINIATDMIDAFGKQPKILQDVELALLAIVAVGGPLLGFMASAKTAMVTLGLVSEASAVGINLVKFALAGLGIGLAIAAIVLLIQNWDSVKKAADELWQKIKEVFGNIKDWIVNTAGAVKDWLEKNWPLILGVLTGPFGLFIVFLVKHKDELLNKFSEVWNAIKSTVNSLISNAIDLWIKTFWGFANRLGSFWSSLTNDIVDVWENLKYLIKDFVQGIVNLFDSIFKVMVQIGKDIANGIMQGLTSMTFSFGSFLKNWINANIPQAVRTILKIQSPSKVMEEIGQYTVMGLYKGMGVEGPVGIQMPQLNIGGGAAGGINITINAGLGTDPYTLGREITTVLQKYGKISSRTVV